MIWPEVVVRFSTLASRGEANDAGLVSVYPYAAIILLIFNFSIQS